MNIHYRNIGLNFHPEPFIKVWAPHARELSMEIEGKTSIPLKKHKMGYWYSPLQGVQPGDRYLLRINGKKSFPDPASLYQPQGVHKASEAVNLRQINKTANHKWKGIPLKDLVVYELHAGTFTPEGTFDGIEKKLDYLKTLGINAIKILPVATFPGERNWGYDGVFPFAVQPSYGGPENFALLVKACHEKGIAVILDVVYNHLGPEGNYLGAFGPYFTGKYNTPWGKAINFDDTWCDGVRDYFLENALMWLRDFNVDGLRLDAVHAIRDFSPKHFLRQLAENVQQLNAHSHGNHFLIAECDLNDTRFINPTQRDGYGMDAQWCDEWHHAIHALLTKEKTGYYADFGRLDLLVKSFNDAYVFTGEYSDHRKKYFGTPTKGLPGERFVIFTQNHDQVGNRMNGDRLSTLVDFESLKLAATAMMASPFIPMIFMGEEYAEDNPFLYFISHNDEQLVEAVRKGRKREFRDFIKDATPPDPAAKDTFNKSKLKWNVEDHAQKKQMLAFYQKLIAIRKSEPLLRPGNRDQIAAWLDESENAILLWQKEQTESVLTAMNFSDREINLFPDIANASDYLLLIYSAHKKWGGSIGNSESPVKTTDKGFELRLLPKSAAMIKLLH